MYDMYSWDRPAAPADSRGERRGSPDGSPGRHAAPPGRRPEAGAGARAVQVALDRRDNGGQAGRSG